MGLFDRYGQRGAKPAEPEPQADRIVIQRGKKGRPTPTREEAEAARMAALHPKLTKRQAAAQDRQAQQQRQQHAMTKAEERPERVLLRNYLDSRWSLPEFSMPALLLVLVGLLAGSRSTLFATFVTMIFYLFLIACIINCIMYWRGFKAELAERHPSASTKGLVFMMVQRMMSIRRFRTPPPVIPRHGKY